MYGEAGLSEPAKEVEVLQIAIVGRPTDAALYAALAEYAYKAKNQRVGDLAAEKAVALRRAPTARASKPSSPKPRQTRLAKRSTRPRRTAKPTSAN